MGETFRIASPANRTADNEIDGIDLLVLPKALLKSCVALERSLRLLNNAAKGESHFLSKNPLHEPAEKSGDIPHRRRYSFRVKETEMKANRNRSKFFVPLTAALLFVAAGTVPAQESSGVPVFQFDKTQSNIKFDVEASVKIAGEFKKWDASFTMTSPDITTGVLDIKIDAASVDTGSGMKNSKLKSDDFFDVEKNPYITFKSTKIVQTGPDTLEVDGDFTIRGVTKQEKLTFQITGKGTGAGTVTGTMAFDRKQYGMNSGIPFIKIANRVEVTVFLNGKRVSGPPVKFQQ